MKAVLDGATVEVPEQIAGRRRGIHKDPITAQGVIDAFHDAESISSALGAAWSGKSSFGR